MWLSLGTSNASGWFEAGWYAAEDSAVSTLSGADFLRRRRRNQYASPKAIAEQAIPTPAPMPADSFLLRGSFSELVSDVAVVGVLVGGLVGSVLPVAAGVDVDEGIAEDDDSVGMSRMIKPFV